MWTTDGRRTTDGRTTEHGYTISSPCEPDGSGELKMVDDGRTTDGRTTEHGYTISSPCEPDGSGELIKMNNMYTRFRTLLCRNRQNKILHLATSLRNQNKTTLKTMRNMHILNADVAQTMCS